MIRTKTMVPEDYGLWPAIKLMEDREAKDPAKKPFEAIVQVSLQGLVRIQLRAAEREKAIDVLKKLEQAAFHFGCVWGSEFRNQYLERAVSDYFRDVRRDYGVLRLAEVTEEEVQREKEAVET